MKISTIGYSVKQGIKNIFRNKMFSLASVATMGACIFLLGIFFCIVVNFQNMVKQAETGVSVSVYFVKGINQERISEIGDLIRKRVEVSECRFVSAEEAWSDFQKDYFKGNEDLAAGLEDDNPLADSEHYEIFLSDVSMQNSLVIYLQSLEGVRQVNKSEMVADTLSNFNVLIGYVSIGIIGILLAVSVFLISNTVIVGIAVRKEEIAIMKLIGATDVFIRAPFVVEGILIGLVGSGIPLILLHILYNEVVEFIEGRFSTLTIQFLTFLPSSYVFSKLIPMSLAIGLGIGFLGSFFTLRKHLKV